MNPTDFSNGISETLNPLTCFDFFAVLGRIRPHALRKGGAALQCNKETSAECRARISFSLSFRFVAALRVFKRVQASGLKTTNGEGISSML